MPCTKKALNLNIHCFSVHNFYLNLTSYTVHVQMFTKNKITLIVYKRSYSPGQEVLHEHNRREAFIYIYGDVYI